MGNPIFISYRRDDTEGEAGRLFDDLTRKFGRDSVFMDVAGIRPGVDFVKAIEQNVANCGVLLAIIGPTWANIAGSDGHRRLDDPHDFVVLEIASALKREVPVIPVLVHGARMPSPDQLPESLKSFSYRNSVELSHARWPSDVQLLIEALDSYVAPDKTTVQDPVHATVPVQLPAPHPAPVIAKPGKRSPVPLFAGIGALVVIAAAVIFYLSTRAPAAGSIVGTWKDPDRKGGDNPLIQLVISGSGSSLTMHAFGGCQPNPCDWGTQPAVVDGPGATATFTLTDQMGGVASNRVSLVKVAPSGSNLDVDVHNTFTAQGNAHGSHAHRTFVPGP